MIARLKSDEMIENEKRQNSVYLLNGNGRGHHLLVTDSVSTIMNLWSAIVIGKVNPVNKQLLLFADDHIQSLIDESEAEMERVQSLLIEGMINKSNTRDKQEYIQINQALLIRLLDIVYSYEQNKTLSKKTLLLYNSISRHLQNTLDFIEDFFGNFFDRNEKVPDSYLRICKDTIKKQLEKISPILEENNTVDKPLADIIIRYINEFLNNNSRTITYINLNYQKEFLNELLSNGALESTQAIRQMLYYLNFNDGNFVTYEYNRLKQLTDQESTKKEKLSLLRFEQKNVNQQAATLNFFYSKNMPCLREQINGWINEEIRFIENEFIPERIENNKAENESKIHTSLSVAKLALLIRLLVIDKIIINRTVAPMLRIAAKMFTTLQREEISFGSLESKYHAPDKATINAVRDMLFKWINILNKL